MTQRKKRVPRWRAVFLRALKRSRNVRQSALAAGVDHGTAYNRRKKDEAFAQQWEEALEEPEPEDLEGGAHDASAAAGENLVVRRSKRDGVQLVRAGEGRWSEKIEAKYLAHLRATGCKRRAAAAVGFSKTAIHNRQINYPDFNARCDDAIAQATSDLHSMVVGAGIATFDPSPEDDDIEVPKVTIAEAIAILKLKGTGSGAGSGSGGGGKAGRYAPPEPSIEEVRASILRKLDAIEAHERREAGECPEDWDEE